MSTWLYIFVSIVNVYKSATFKTNRRRSSQKWQKNVLIGHGMTQKHSVNLKKYYGAG